MKPPYAIGPVPSLSGHAIAYRWRSLPRVRRHRASKPQGSSERVLPWQIAMDQLIFASLSHTHYWYEVCRLKIPAYSVGEEDRDSLDAGAGETAEERGTAATTTCHRSSGAKVRSDRPVPILGRPCQRRWRTRAGDQPPEQSSVGMHQGVLPGALRPAESTVET